MFAKRHWTRIHEKYKKRASPPHDASSRVPAASRFIDISYLLFCQYNSPFTKTNSVKMKCFSRFLSAAVMVAGVAVASG
jgi:hypothetical protein